MRYLIYLLYYLGCILGHQQRTFGVRLMPGAMMAKPYQSENRRRRGGSVTLSGRTIKPTLRRCG